jgi:hypothetical protein
MAFQDFNFQDGKIFPEFKFEKYVTVEKVVDGKEIVKPRQEILNLFQSRILTLLDVPHFKMQPVIVKCVQLLMSWLHGGYLWLDKTYLVDEDLMY